MDHEQVAKVAGGVLVEKSSMRFRWTFQIYAGTDAWIGIIPAEFDITAASVSECDQVYGISQKGKLYPSGQFFSPAFTSGAVVDMELDLDELTLQYFIDGERMGIAFRNLPEGVTFTAALYLHEEADEIAVLNWGIYWPWDNEWGPCGSKVLVRGGRVVIKQEEDGWEASTAISATAVTIPDSPVPMDQPSKQRWSVQIMQGTSALIGLVTQQFDPQTDGGLHQTLNGWALSQNGLVGHGGECINPYCAKFDSYAIVDVEVDINMKTLRFYINGKDCGVAYNLPVATFHLGVSIREQRDGVFLSPCNMKRFKADMASQTWDPNRIGKHCKKVIKRGLVCVEKVKDEAGGGSCCIHAHASIGQVGRFCISFFPKPISYC